MGQNVSRGRHRHVGGEWTRVQGKSAGAASSGFTSLPVALDAAPTNGSLLVACVMLRDNTATPETSVAIAGWTRHINNAIGGSISNFTVAIFSKVANGDGATVTATVSNSQENGAIVVEEWAGVDVGDRFDVGASNDETGADGFAATAGPTAAIARANSLAVAACCIADDDLDPTPSFSNGFTLRAEVPNGVGVDDCTLAVGTAIIAAAGATPGTVCTWTGSDDEERFSAIAIFRVD